MTNILFLDIPQERMGVLIGKNGEIKKRMEEILNIKINIQSDGVVKVEYNTEDPETYFKLRRIADAICCGFSGEDALKLMDGKVVLKKIDLRDFADESSSRMKILKDRIIGRGGKIWKKIEKLANVRLALYRHVLGIIGEEENCEIALKTILKILGGAQFGTAFKYLEHQRKSVEKGIWLSREERMLDES